MYIIIWHTQSLFCHHTALPITLQLGKYMTSEYEILTNPLGERSAPQTCYPYAWAAAMHFSKSSTLSKEPISVNAMECRLPYRASDYQERVHWILCTSKQRGIDLKKVKLLEGRPVFLNTSLKWTRACEETREDSRELSVPFMCKGYIYWHLSYTDPAHAHDHDRSVTWSSNEGMWKYGWKVGYHISVSWS